ncbi:hypothetical protein BBP40_000705 [Aspergillus hancockii]|nr:hypothetical protein BBP40_000705 [Aspergillus hancockii]
MPGMPQRSNSIKQYFKRPDFSLSSEDFQPEAPKGIQSSPITEPSSSFVSNEASPQTPDGAALQLKQSLLLSVTDAAENRQHQENPQSDETVASDPSLLSSFSLAQRVVKNGREVVISSDGDDTDSSEFLEDPNNLFMKFVKQTNDSTDEQSSNDSSGQGRSLRSRRLNDEVKPSKFPLSRASKPTYKHTIDSLVTQAVDDNETEAGIAKLRAIIEEDVARKAASKSEAASASHDQSRQLHEGILTSALDDKNDETGLRRLLDAVRRTEAFDMEKSWSFFDYGGNLAPPPVFPRECIASKSYISALREPESRERAFHSGTVDFALSRGFLPDDLIMWILNSVPSEPRNSLRHVYCRAFKNVSAERIQSLIRPKDINALFQRMSANPKALVASEVIVPDAIPKNSSIRSAPQHKAALLSVLNLLHGAADLFSEDTRERILNLLFRLSLDISLISDPIICPELERTVTAVLESIPEGKADELVNRICASVYETITDVVFQSRLLTHILPTSSWIAMLRCRLAISFLTCDRSPLTEEPDMNVYLKQIITVLKDKKFDVKRYKSKGPPDYDYGELMAITTLLNIAIDSSWSSMDFPSKDAEREFNSEIDLLADRIKKIFTSIEDSGASHLKRTLAKEALEALHYRIVYSVRSKPRPKRSIFGDNGVEHQHPDIRKWAGPKIIKDPGIPIRQHEISP